MQTALDLKIEQVMFDALQQAQAEGLTDADEIRQRIIDARDAALGV